tara:strand:- start:2806 stop:4089 length:1284 start_codon:yes stop_codon:yes gene_type:complete
MAGSPKSVNTDTPIDPKYLQYLNSLSSGGNTTNITSSKDSIKQYVKTKNGIFNGAFGSVAQILNISSGVLDLTANSTGAVVVRRVVYVLTESGSTDTLTAIDVNDLELPNQELTLMTSTSTTITITHDATAPGTQRPIHCPGDTDYILSSQEAVTLIFDAIHKIWIITSKGVTSVGTGEILDTNVTFAKIQNLNTMKVIGRTASGAGVSSEISILDEDTMSSNSATALATQQSIKAYVASNTIANPIASALDLNGNQLQGITTAFFNGDIDNANSISGNTGGLDYNVDDTDEIHDFQVDGVSKFTVGNTQINMITHLSMSGKTIYLDSDVDSTIDSVTDDIINIATGGSIRLAISNTSTIATGNLSILGNLTVNGATTLGDNGSDLINIPGLVNFTGNYSAVAQTAGNSTGYITIQIGGVAKKLYYY